MRQHKSRSGASAADWRTDIPEPRRRLLRAWLWSGAILTFLIVVIGGITRLTQSGLSIVDWNPIMGAIPPLNEAEWNDAFARYQAFPEYQQIRQGMALAEFKFIFFWEYFHRLVARIIGLAFLIPFALFWWRGYLPPPLRRRVLVLFALGAVQGFMGWFMVSSGLVDDPRVSHYRLASHLTIALSIFGYCLWLIRELSLREPRGPAALRAAGARWVYGLGALLVLQILWGAFVAGLDAGLIFNTFPRMGDGLVPPGALTMDPAVLNLFANPFTVQFVHRLLGTVLLITAAACALGSRGDWTFTRYARAFAALVAVQYSLGIATLVLLVPVSLGVLHQATAVLILGIWLFWLHEVRRAPELTVTPRSMSIVGRRVATGR